MNYLKQKLISHLFNDLLKYWDRDSALGYPIGNFPTYRNNDGSNFDYHNPSNEYLLCDKNLYKPYRDYVRMKARQCYAYGLSYQLTNKKKYLDYMKKGLDYLTLNARDSDDIFYSYYSIDSKRWGPEALQRTSQDIAYALCGYSLYYSITKESNSLDIIMRHISYIEENYYDEQNALVKWVVKKSVDGDSPESLKLVSILDQIYAYLLCLAKCPANPYINKIYFLLDNYVGIIKQKFYWSEKNMFYGEYNKTEKRGVEGEHTDFGHSIKAFWMIHEVGLILNKTEWLDFAKNNIITLLPKAFDEQSGSWGRKWNSDGSLDRNKEWWSVCILNQVAALFSKYHPEFIKYLKSSLEFWLKNMTDHTNGGVWHFVDANTHKPDKRFPKQHIWKNAFHEFEHVSIILSYIQ